METITVELTIEELVEVKALLTWAGEEYTYMGTRWGEPHMMVELEVKAIELEKVDAYFMG